MSKEENIRNIKLTCLTNEEEKKLIDSYLRKYNISNRSRWMRETIIAFILKNLDQDYPTLFKEQDMRR
jgi:hypothetical protein